MQMFSNLLLLKFLCFQYNDVAILTMDRPVEFTQNIRPICLPTGQSDYTGKVATVIGWGSLRESKIPLKRKTSDFNP